MADRIELDSFPDQWYGSSWSDTHNNENQFRYVYICAAAWYCRISGTEGVFSDTDVTAICSYWDGTQWVEGGTITTVGSHGNNTQYAGHNREEKASPRASTGRCDNEYPLWRIKYWYSNGKSKHWRITVWAGGWGVAYDTHDHSPINYPKGKKIYSTGSYDGNIYTAPDAVDAGTPISGPLANVYNYKKRRGSPIMGAYKQELVYYPYAR